MKTRILASLLALTASTLFSYVQAQDINLTGYTLTFDDEFNNLSVTSNSPKGSSTWYYWPPYGAAGAYSESTWTTSAFSVSNGILSDEAYYSGGSWYSGNLSSVDNSAAGFSQQYGYFEICCQMPNAGEGAWPAFWLEETSGIPAVYGSNPIATEEVDVFEWYGVTNTPGNDQDYVQEASHNWNANGSQDQTLPYLYDPTTPMPDEQYPWQGYHIYGCQIDPVHITWYIDGVQTNQIATPTSHLTGPFYIMVDYALGGGWSLSGTPFTTDGTSTLLVNWVRAYSLPTTPVITSSNTATGTEGSAFSYQIAATNSPTSYNATGLPAGLSVNTSTGAITGTPTAYGSFSVTLSAINGGGTGTTTLSLTINSSGGSGGSIGVDFSGGDTPVPATTLAGFVAQEHWNNVSTATGTNSTLSDSTGATVSGLSASWGSNGSNTLYGFDSDFTGTNSTGNTDLYSSSLLTYGSVGGGYQGHITLTGIPYTSYTVYAYFAGTGNGIVNLNGTPNGTEFTGGTTYSFSSANVSNYVQATTSGGAANYAVFTGVTGSSVTVYAQQGSSGGLVGIQIVPTASAPVITSSTSATGTVGSAFSYQITATNSPTSYNATGLPAGLSVNTSTGAISGTPTTAGTSSVTISATNSGGTGTATLSLTVNSSGGSGASIGLDFSGGGTSLPATTLAGFAAQEHWNNASTATGSNSTLTDSTGATVSGATAAWGSNGSNTLYSFGSSFTGTNSTGNTDLYSSSLLTYGSVGGGYQGHVTVTGIPYSSYTVYAYFAGSGNGIVNLNGTPNGTEFTGGTSYTFSSANVSNFVQATTSGGAANYAVFSGVTGSSLTLYAQQGSSGGLVGVQIVSGSGSSAPVITSSNTATGTVGSAFSYQITATNSPTSYNATGLPAGLSVNTSTGTITGTPTASGTSSVTISATNSAGTGTATLTLKVTASIGLDFSGGDTPIPATTLAGFVAQDHWNNASTATGSNSAVVDSSGSTVSGVSASWGSNGSNTLYGFDSDFTGTNSTGNTDLYSSSLLTYGSVGGGYQGHLTVTGIPYSSYTVYVYFAGSGNGIVNLNGTPNGTEFTGGTSYTFSSANVSNYVQATTSGGAANYAVFSGVTGSSLTVYAQQGSDGGLVGIQIVPTP